MAGSRGVTPLYADLESALILPIDPPRRHQGSASVRTGKARPADVTGVELCEAVRWPVWRTGRLRELELL